MWAALGKAALGATKATVATGARVGGGAVKMGGRAVRHGMLRGRRGRQQRRDKIQQGLFGGGEGGGMLGGGPLALTSSSGIVSAGPTSQQSVGQVPTGGGVLGILQAIRSTLSQILEVEKQQRDRIHESILNFTKDKEKAARTAEQQAQEAKNPNRKKGGRLATAVKGPAQDLLGALGDFVKLGVLNWLSDPKNKEAVQGIIEFVKDLVKVFQFLWKHLLEPIGRLGATVFMGAVEGLGKIFDVLGSIFSGKIFSDPAAYFGDIFKSLIELPRWYLEEYIPKLIGAVMNFITFGMIDNADQIVRNIIEAIKNFFGGIFGGGGDKGGGSTNSNFLGGSLPGQEGKSGVDGKDGSAGKDGMNGKDGNLTPSSSNVLKSNIKNDGGSKYNKNNMRKFNRKDSVSNVMSDTKFMDLNRSMHAETKAAAASPLGSSFVSQDMQNKYALEFSRRTKDHGDGTFSVMPNSQVKSGDTLNQVQKESNVLESSFTTDSQSILGMGSSTVNEVDSVVSSSSLGDNFPTHGQWGTTFRTVV